MAMAHKDGWLYLLSGTQHFFEDGKPICGAKGQVAFRQPRLWFEEEKRCANCENKKRKAQP